MRGSVRPSIHPSYIHSFIYSFIYLLDMSVTFGSVFFRGPLAVDYCIFYSAPIAFCDNVTLVYAAAGVRGPL